MKSGKVRVGVIGAGLIAQVMHLPYLTELDQLFEVRAVCDASRKVANACAARFHVEKAFTDWRELLEEQLDAVLVLTSGSHAPIAVAAAQSGKHVFVEKPMCFSVAEGNEMLRAAGEANVALMVGYPKRYDPAYRRAADEVQKLTDLRFVRLTTMESPFQPYVAHYPLLRGDDIGRAQLAEWGADNDRRLRAAVGDVSELALKTYHLVLLDSMVHEFNLLRGILGEPSELKFVSMRDTTVNVIIDFNGVECSVVWVDLPGIARYEMEVCFYDPRSGSGSPSRPPSSGAPRRSSTWKRVSKGPPDPLWPVRSPLTRRRSNWNWSSSTGPSSPGGRRTRPGWTACVTWPCARTSSPARRLRDP